VGDCGQPVRAGDLCHGNWRDLIGGRAYRKPSPAPKSQDRRRPRVAGPVGLRSSRRQASPRFHGAPPHERGAEPLTRGVWMA
jgi:hypothetical protein